MSEARKQSPTVSEARKQYEESCVANGHLVFNPAGNLVKLRPGSIRLAISLEKGEYFEGLKDGWKLATKADYKKKETEEAARQKRGE